MFKEKFQGKKAIHPVYCTGNMADSVEVRKKSKKAASCSYFCLNLTVGVQGKPPDHLVCKFNV